MWEEEERGAADYRGGYGGDPSDGRDSLKDFEEGWRPAASKREVAVWD